MTDCGALKMPDEPTAVLSAAAALNAGSDLNCGEVFSTGLLTAIGQNLTTEARVDAAVERSVGLLMQGILDVGLVSPRTAYSSAPRRPPPRTPRAACRALVGGYVMAY